MADKETIQAKVPKSFIQGQPQDISNRINQVRQDLSTDKDLSILLIDVDTAVLDYINKIIQPKIKQNNELINVPVMMAAPERWIFS